MSEIDNRRAQVVAQYRAVAHMARALAEVHEQSISIIDLTARDGMLDAMGRRSHSIMDTLGDVLNGMDAVTDDDGWIDPIFDQARAMFPLKDPS